MLTCLRQAADEKRDAMSQAELHAMNEETVAKRQTPLVAFRVPHGCQGKRLPSRVRGLSHHVRRRDVPERA